MNDHIRSDGHDTTAGREHVEILLPGCTDPACCWTNGPQAVTAVRVGDDTFRITEVPLDSTDVGIGDVVLALTHVGALEFVTVVERHCIASISFVLPGRTAALTVLDQLRSVGVDYRVVAAHSVVVNLTSAASAHDAVAIIERSGLGGLYCDHELLHWHEISRRGAARPGDHGG